MSTGSVKKHPTFTSILTFNRIYTFHFRLCRLCTMTSPLQRASVCLPLLFFCTVNCASNIATDELLKYSLQDKILEFIERTMQYYYYSDVTNTDRDVDLNLMLGISIMKGKVNPNDKVLNTCHCTGNEIIYYFTMRIKKCEKKSRSSTRGFKITFFPTKVFVTFIFVYKYLL